jgi:hypothetical protein
MAARGIVGALIVALAAFGGADAHADDLQKACGDTGDRTFGACALRYVGARSADDYVRQGDELIRVVVTKPERIVGALIVVEIVLPKSGDATLTVRDPYLRAPSQTHHVTRERFAALRQRLLEADHLLKAVEIGHKEGAAHGCTEETICLHPAVGFVDLVLNGEPSSVYLDACGDFFQIVDDIMDLAVEADSTCSDNLSDWWEPNILQACLNVRGNRRLAAAGFGAAATMGDGLAGSETERNSVRARIADDAHLLVGNELVATGPSGILTWWSEVAARGDIWLRSIDAIGEGDRSIVTGTIGQRIDAGRSDTWFTARFVQTWQEDQKGKVNLIEWRIGEFRPK